MSDDNALGLLAIDWALIAVALWMAIGLLGLPALRRFKFVATVLFPLGGLESEPL